MPDSDNGSFFIPFLYDQNEPNIGIGPTNLQTHKIISAFSVVEE